MYIYIYVYTGLYVGGVFTNGKGDLGLIPFRDTPKTLKTVLDITLLMYQE